MATNIFDDVLAEAGGKRMQPGQPGESNIFDDVLSGGMQKSNTSMKRGLNKTGQAEQYSNDTGSTPVMSGTLSSVINESKRAIAENPGGGRMVAAGEFIPANEQQEQVDIANHQPPSPQALATLDTIASRAIHDNEAGGRVIRTAGGRERYKYKDGLETLQAKPLDNRSDWEKRDKTKDNFFQKILSPVMERNEFQYKNADELTPDKRQEQLDYLFRSVNPDSYDKNRTPDYSPFIKLAQKHGYAGKNIKSYLDTSERVDIPLAPTGDGFTGGVAEVGRGAARGIAQGVEDVAKAGQWAAPAGSEFEGIFKDIAKGIEEHVKRNPQLYMESDRNRQRAWYNPMKALVGGPEMVGRMAPGLVVGGAGVPLQFFGSTAQDKYDELSREKPGMSEGKKIAYATGEGIVQGGLEYLQTVIPAKMLGKLIPGKAKGEILRKAAGLVKANKKDIIGAVGLAYLEELATETGQDMGSKELDFMSGLEKEGVSLGDIGESLKQNAGPILFTSGFLGTPAHISNTNTRKRIGAALTGSTRTVSPQQRMAATKLLYSYVAQKDKELADEWLREALPLALENRPIAIPTDATVMERKIARLNEAKAGAVVDEDYGATVNPADGPASSAAVQPENVNVDTSGMGRVKDLISSMENAPQEDIDAIHEAISEKLADPNISPEDMQAIIDSGVLDTLGMEAPSTVLPGQKPAQGSTGSGEVPSLASPDSGFSQEEWDAQVERALKYNQEKNKPEDTEYARIQQIPEKDRTPREREYAKTYEDYKAYMENKESLEDGVKESLKDEPPDDTAVDHTPVDLANAIGQMRSDMKDGEVGYRFKKDVPEHAPYDADAGKFEGVKSTNPDWLKNDKLLRKVGKKRISRVMDLVAGGKKLTQKQSDIWDALRRAARSEMENNPALLAGQEAERIQKEEGIDVGSINETVTAGALSPGDKIVVKQNDGVPDVLEHKGFDAQGNAILEDGKIIHVDPFEQIDIIGKKEGHGSDISDKIADDIEQISKETDVAALEDARDKISKINDKKIAPYKELLLGSIGRRLDEVTGKNEQAKEEQQAGQEKEGKTEKGTAGEERIETVDNLDSVAHGQEVNINPTDGQKEAGNYKKPHVSLDGLDITIENPVGTERSGVDKTGRKWSQVLANDYGYILQTEAIDGDHVDVFIVNGYKGGADYVHVVNQYNDDGTFDEPKVVLGAKTKGEARRTYKANYEKGWKGGKEIVRLSLDDFKRWVKSDAPKKGPAVDTEKMPIDSKGKQANKEKPAQKPKAIKLTKRQQEIMDWLDAGNSFKDFDTVPVKKQPIDTGYRPSPKVIENLINKGLIEFLPNHGENGEWYSVKVIERDNMRKVDAEIAKDEKKESDSPGVKTVTRPSEEAGEATNNNTEPSADAEEWAKKNLTAPASSKTTSKQSEASAYGQNNKLVSQSRADEIRAKLRAKLNNINSGVDPELISLGTELAVFHIEAGARRWIDFTKAMVNDLGEKVRPFLRSFYEGARYYPGLDNKGMSSAEEIESAAKIEKKKVTFSSFVKKLKTTGVAIGQDGTKYSLQQNGPGQGYYIRTEKNGVRMEKGGYPRGGGWGYHEAIQKIIDLAFPGNKLDGTPAKGQANVKAGDYVKTEKQYSHDTEKQEAASEAGKAAAGKTWKKVVDISDYLLSVRSDNGWNLKSITQVRRKVADHFRVSAAEADTGEFKKKVDEAVEYAVVKLSRTKIREGLNANLSATQIFNQLVEVYNDQPRLGVRTSTSSRNQAYSTPAPIAWLANYLGGVYDQRSGRTVYEPSAGTGMLLIGVSPDSVIANEIDESRAELLRHQGFLTTIDDSASNDVSAMNVDRVIANPPFGTVKDESGRQKKWKVGGLTTRQIDHAISLNALTALDNNGKAVLIVGGLDKQVANDKRAKKYSAKTKKDFFKTLYNGYHVVDHFTVAGDLYNKQGAGWPIDIIVIDRRGRSGKATPDFVAPPVYRTFDEIRRKLDEIEKGDATHFGVDATRKEQEKADTKRSPRTIATGSAFSNSPTNTNAVSGEAGKASGTGGTGRPVRLSGTAGQSGANAAGNQGHGGGSGRIGGGRPNAPGINGDRKPGTVNVSRSGKSGKTGGSAGGKGTAGQSNFNGVAGGTGTRSKRPVESEGQTLYAPSSGSTPIGTLTPTNLSTPIKAALGKLAEIHGSVDNYVSQKLQYHSSDALHEALSAEQIDAVALAISNIESGSGFILGDQTGIGKGRVVASVIKYSLLQGKIPVFVTEKQGLYADMYRDLVDIGMPQSIVDDIMQTNTNKVVLDADAGIKLTSPAGWNNTLASSDGMPTVGKGKNRTRKKIVFTTYDQLNIGAKEGADNLPPRRQFLKNLVQKENVILIMDESHNAGGSGDIKNLKANKETGIVPYPRALFFRDILSHTDGVLYSSATYAKNPEVMDLYKATDLKLGVNGDIDALADAIHIGGIPFQGITASMLAESGQYIRRERSFDGVEYTPKTMNVNTAHAESISSVMSAIRAFEDEFITSALDNDEQAVGSSALGVSGQQSQNFTSLMHNIINQSLLALKVEPSVREAIKVLRDGENNNEQVVLTVANTMGAFIKQYAEDNNLSAGDEISLSFNDLLYRYLYKTREYTVKGVKANNGQPVRFYITDEDLGPEGVSAYKRVEKAIYDTDLSGLPVSPVDYMLNELKKAGFPGLEITGRDWGVDYSGDVPILYRRSAKERSVDGRNKIIKQFNNGESRAVILNKSGSTGISLHASERNPASGQGRRTMIIVQAEADINVHMQMLGRVHRTGQVVPPRCIQAVANIPAERKPAAVLLSKMAGLNANTTASADSAFTDKETVNFMNKYGDRIVARVLKARPELNKLLGSPVSGSEKGVPSGLAKKVTGRLPLLTIDQQEDVYREIEDTYKDLIAELDATGRNDLVTKTYDLDAETVDTFQVTRSTGSSPFQGEVIAETVEMNRIGKPYSGKEVLKLVEQNKGGGDAEAEEALSGYDSFQNSQLQAIQDKIDAEENISRKELLSKKLEDRKRKIQKIKREFQALNSIFKVGNTVTVSMDTGTGAMQVGGVVVGKKATGKTANPLALSGWRVTIAVADGIRTINLPMSRFEQRPGGDASDSGKIGIILDEAAANERDVVAMFDNVLMASRERRVMITGNLFSGFSLFSGDGGQIINFTRHNGEVTQGILMPRGFSPRAAINNRPVVIPNADTAMAYFGAVGNSMLELNRSGDVRVTQAISGTERVFRLSTAGAVRTAGKYFKDDKVLLEIVGDFHSVGGRMLTDPLTEEQVKKVFELFTSRGAAWVAKDNLDTARSLVEENVRNSTSEPGAVYGTIKQQGGIEYEVRANRRRTTAGTLRNGAGTGVQEPEQLDLFTSPTVGKKEARKAKRSYKGKVKHARSGAFHYDGEKADSHATIAQIATPIMDEAQENNLAVMTDKNEKPVVVLRHSTGLTASAPLDPKIILGVAHSVPEVTNIWIVHNHPSGNAVLSPQDMQAATALHELADGTGLKIKGIVAVTPDGKYSGFDGDLLTGTRESKAPSKQGGKVRGIVRKVSRLPNANPLKSDNEAGDWINNNIPGQSGILLLNASHVPVSFVPMSVKEMQEFRTGEKGSGASKVLAEVESTNGTVAIIVTAQRQPDGKLKNPATFLTAHDINIIDIFNGGQSMHGGVGVDRVLGDAPVSSIRRAFYSKTGAETTGTTTQQVRRAARKFLGNGGYSRWRKNGTLRVVQSVGKLPDNIKRMVGSSRSKGEGDYNYVLFSDEDVSIQAIYSKDGQRVAGYYNPADGSITLIADNIKPDEVEDVLIHEGSHRLLETDPQFIKDRERILSSLDKFKGKQGEAVKAAREKAVEAEGEDADPELLRKETLAYFLQDKKNRTLPLYRRIIAAVKLALRRIGIPTGKLTVDDIVSMFIAGIKKDARKGGSVSRSNTNGEILKSYAGEESRTADRSKLFDAIRMHKFGEDVEKIRQETGWHLGKDNRWRYEIDDSEARSLPLGNLETEYLDGQKVITGKLSDVLDHQKLFKAYPQLKDVDVFIYPDENKNGIAGGYTRGKPGTIEIHGVGDKLLLMGDKKSTLLHEVQHAIQDIEGFSFGGSIDSLYNKHVKNGVEAAEASALARKDYRNLLGEIEARDTATRKDMTAEQRKSLPPYTSEGIPMEDAIVMFSGDGAGDVMFSKVPKQKEKKILKKGYVSARGTENLNATRDGVTSSASESIGNQIIASIMEKLAAVNPPSTAKKYSKSEIQKAMDAYQEAATVIDDPAASIAEKQKFAATFATVLPQEPRAKLLKRLAQIARVKQPKTQLKRLNGFLKRADKVLADHYRRKMIEKIKDRSKKFKLQKDKIARGRGAELERDLKYLRETVLNITVDEGVITEQASLDSQLAVKQKELMEARTDSERADIQEEIDNLKSYSTLLDVFGNLKQRGFYDVLAAYNKLAEIIEEKRAPWRAVQAEWRAKNKYNRGMAYQEITGLGDPRDETVAEQRDRLARERSFKGKIKETLSNAENMIQSWELLLDKISSKAGKKILNSWMVKHFSSLAHAATRSYEKMQFETNELLSNKAMEIFKVKDRKQLGNVFANLNKEQENKVFIYPKNRKNKQAVRISPMQAAYWYQISRDSQNPVVLATFKEMGVTDETLRQIEKLIGPRLKAWADYLVDEFYQDFHTETNKIYRQMYGIDLEKTKNYVPWYREVTGKIADKDIGGFLAGVENGTLKKGSLRERVNNTKAYRVMNINDVLINHVTDMNHFKAWALPVREINGTFNDPLTQKFIRQNYGTGTLRAVKAFQKDFAKSPNEILREKIGFLDVDRLRSRLTVSLIGMNPTIFLKQLTSIPAYAADVPIGAWISGTGYALRHPIEAGKILGTSQMMKSRYLKGFERDVANAMKRGSGDTLAMKKGFSEKVMKLTSLGDKAAIVIGGYAVYNYHKQKALKAGKTDQQAHEIGINEFEKATERSQQSGNVKDLGLIQRGGPGMRLFTMFMTTPASYSRLMYTAVRHAKNDKAKAAKVIAIYGVILPAVFSAVSDALLLHGGGDDDDKKKEENRYKMLKNMAEDAVLSPFNGLPFVRTMAEGAANAATGKPFRAEFSPVFSILTRATYGIKNTRKAIKGGTKRIGADEYLVRALWDFAEVGGNLAGVPVRPARNMGTGIYDAVTGNTDYPLRRSLGYSKYAVGE